MAMAEYHPPAAPGPLDGFLSWTGEDLEPVRRTIGHHLESSEQIVGSLLPSGAPAPAGYEIIWSPLDELVKTRSRCISFSADQDQALLPPSPPPTPDRGLPAAPDKGSPAAPDKGSPAAPTPCPALCNLKTEPLSPPPTPETAVPAPNTLNTDYPALLSSLEEAGLDEEDYRLLDIDVTDVDPNITVFMNSLSIEDLFNPVEPSVEGEEDIPKRESGVQEDLLSPIEPPVVGDEDVPKRECGVLSPIKPPVGGDEDVPKRECGVQRRSRRCSERRLDAVDAAEEPAKPPVIKGKRECPSKRSKCAPKRAKRTPKRAGSNGDDDFSPPRKLERALDLAHAEEDYLPRPRRQSKRSPSPADVPEPPAVKGRSARKRGPRCSPKSAAKPFHPGSDDEDEDDPEEEEFLPSPSKRQRQRGDASPCARSGTCNKCGNDYVRLDKHQLVHRDVRPHACDHCSKRFRQSEHLKRHVLAKHTPQRGLHHCSRCGKGLSRKDKLKEHLILCRE